MASRSRNPTNLNFLRGALIATDVAEVAVAAVFEVDLAVVAAVLVWLGLWWGGLREDVVDLPCFPPLCIALVGGACSMA